MAAYILNHHLYPQSHPFHDFRHPIEHAFAVPVVRGISSVAAVCLVPFAIFVVFYIWIYPCSSIIALLLVVVPLPSLVLLAVVMVLLS